MVPRGVLLLCSSLALSAGGSASTTTLRCYMDRVREPVACPDGMSLDLVALRWRTLPDLPGAPQDEHAVARLRSEFEGALEKCPGGR